MQILKIDEKFNQLKLVPDSLDDLWHLEKVLESGDIVEGRGSRKIKPKNEGEKPERIPVFIKLEMQEAEFHKFSGKLRVSGIILEGKPAELVEVKSHHSLEFEPGTKISIQKKHLKKYQIERIENAKKAGFRSSILAVLLDDENAFFYSIKDFGVDTRAKISAAKQGKRYETGESTGFFEEIISKTQEIAPKIAIFAGPGFAKEKLQKIVENREFEFKSFFYPANSVGKTGLNELLKGDIVDKAVSETALSQETRLVERLFEELGKETGKAVYGLEEVEKAVQMGAVETLLVHEKTLLENREKTEHLMDIVEKMQGKVHIVSAENEPGKKLDSIGGIAAILRYQVFLT